MSLTQLMEDPDGLAILALCRADPQSITPRLVLANYLDERLQSAWVAECLRLSLRSPTLIPFDQASLVAWWPFVGCLGGLLHVQVGLELVSAMRRVLAVGPVVQSLHLQAFNQDGMLRLLHELAALRPQRLWLQRVAVWGQPGMRQVMRQPLIVSAIHLKLDGQRFGTGSLWELANSPALQTLVALDLSRCDLTDTIVQELIRGPVYPHLRQLTLGKNRLGDGTAAGLAGSDNFPQLQVLDLDGNRLGPGAATSLAQGSGLKKLESLELSGNPLQDSGGSTLLGKGLSTRLRYLDLAETGLGARGGLALATATWLGRERFQSLRGNQVGQGALEAIFRRWSSDGTGPRLDLARCGLDDGCLDRLIAVWQGGQSLAQVRELSLADNPLSGEAIARLAASGCLEDLELLDISGVPKAQEDRSREWLQGLAVASMTNLQHLVLARCSGFAPEDYTLLAGAPWIAQLRSLDLSDPRIDGAREPDLGWALAGLLTRCGKLESLHLAGMGLQVDDLRLIAGAGCGACWRELNLSRNPLGEELAEWLPKGWNLPSLEILELAQVGGTSRLATRLGMARVLPALRVLDLSGNREVDSGALDLCRVSGFASLERLVLWNSGSRDIGLLNWSRAASGQVQLMPSQTARVAPLQG